MEENRQNTDYLNYYEKIEELGKGGNGVVYKIKERGTDNHMAIKIIDKNKFKEIFKKENFRYPNEEEMKPYIEDCLKEIQNMKIAEGKNEENENTVKFIEYFDTQKEFCMVMELCNKNLLDYIAQKDLNDEEIYEILSQLNNTFRIMAAKKIAHRDLKLENILIKYDNSDNSKFTVKLTDFGESKKLAITNKYTQVGTCQYTAPEILEGKEYNVECDLWSLGIIIHVLVFKKYPYKGETFIAVNKQIKSGINKIQKLGTDKNPYIDNLISRLLIKNPKERMTWEEYFRNPFFTNRDYKKYYNVGKRIGGGGFGEVFEAKLKRNNKDRAIKIMDKIKIREEIFKKKIRKATEEDMKPYIDGFYNEITVMEMLESEKDNDNTVKFYEFFDTDNEFVIVMELCDENLLDFLAKKERPFNCREIYDLLSQLNNSFKIMVKNKLVHRDLKLENILIKYKNAEKTKYEVKLTDYGISRQLLSLTKKLTTKIGTNVFMAPEVEHGEKYNQECDLWSIGIIINILFFKKYPEIKDNNDQIKSTGNLDLDDLIRKLLVVNPENRLSWNNYFDHSFFKNNIFEQNQIIIEIEVRNQDKINNEFKDMYFLECNYYYESDKQKPFPEENE